jgi:serine/threonine protein phosphatase PrpC
MGNLLGAPVTEKETHVGTTSDGTLRYGVSSMQGWRVHMEDAHITEGRLYAAAAVVENSTTTSINSDAGSGGTTAASTPSPTAGVKYEKIALPGHALFAVFDGHGGTYAATYAGHNFCRVLSRQERFVQYARFVQERATKEATLAATSPASERTEYIRSGLKILELSLADAFVDLDREIAMALKGQKVADADLPYHNPEDDDEDHDHTTSCELPEGGLGGGENGNSNMDGVTKSSSESLSSPTDSALQLLEDEGDSGTTACVVLVTPEWVICANAGDSRSVISRMSKSIPLSYDHKPDDEGEERRIRASGGYVAGGRVEGDLAVSRGLGDFRFKNLDVVMAAKKLPDNGDQNDPQAEQDQSRQRRPVTKPGEQKVSPIPDILIHSRSAKMDEFIIVACDGIWDVQTNYEAVKLVAELFNEGELDIGMICEELCDVCLGMGSKDNMTALVVQLEGQTVGTGGGVLARRQLRDSSDTSHHQARGSSTDHQS